MTYRTVMAEAIAKLPLTSLTVDDDVGRIVAALAEAGYVIVPREPTVAMYKAALFPSAGSAGDQWREMVGARWRAMVGAAS